MADSDDEYDRKRRDKFRGERSAGDSYRSERREDRRGGGGGRDDWNDRNPFRGRARPDYGEYRGGGGGRGRDRYSPGRDLPPPKRMRPDWGDEGRPRYGGHEGYPMYGWGHEPYPMHPGHGGYGGHPQMNNHSRGEAAANPDLQTQPPMLTLKQFLDTQDDTISDSEVLRKYSEYKLEFKRQQLNEFFVAHKDEEWFKNKYHPEESSKRKEEQLGFLKRRVDVFSELLEKGQITNVSVDTNQTDPLLRLLDTVVIKLEGGTEEDLKALDEKPQPIQESFSSSFQSKFDSKRNINDKDDDDVIITEVQPIPKRIDDFNEADWALPAPAKASTSKGTDGDDWDSIDTNSTTVKKSANVNDDDDWDSFDNAPKKKESANVDGDDWDSFDTNTSKKKFDKAKEDDWSCSEKPRKTTDDGDNWNDFDAPSHSTTKKNGDDWDAREEPGASTSGTRKRSRSESSSSSSQSSKAGDNDLSDQPEQKSPEPQVDESEEKSLDNSMDHEEENKKAEEVVNLEEPSNEMQQDTDPLPAEGVEANEKQENGSSEKEKESEEQQQENEEEKPKKEEEEVKVEEGGEKKSEEEENKTETIDLDKEKDPEPETPKPRALHRTSSIFLRNLAPTITKSEIEAVCKRYDGFLRVAIADPLVERRWFRRGWVTFKRDVNIKEICWNLNNIRLRDCEMGAIVNRDLSRRVRPVNGITAHKTIVRSDIKLCAKIALNLDEKFGLWIEEARREGNATNGDSSTMSFGFKSNNPVLQNITDFLIEEASAEEDELLGLTGSENKDTSDGEMLDRDTQLIIVLDKLILYLRIVHSVDFYNHCEYPYEDEMPNRCGIIHARGPAPQNKITNNDIQEYIKNFENKMTSFLSKSSPIEEDELKNLGIKDPEAEVEKFIQANTQELAKDKWLCPLSGKKFKGPEFIRKHIFNKHIEKVDEVRKEVEYFNNYLRDAKRPQLPEHPGNTRRQPAEAMAQQMPYRPAYGAPAYAPPYAAYAPPMVAPPRPRGFGVGGGGRRGQGGDYRPIIHYRDLDAPHESVDIL
ncbi:serrate RNA effector molecule homolog isoform X2 [Hermetia illucens]|uniref:serrate RNA effector molecule homolog isoform X2 n=1 Tax=Hermetia illucens TaxID=343691 RepID=UPI0018CC4E12|nr:serrate RNA effector molecule homolog isoform X2 [Hermetia illucens]